MPHRANHVAHQQKNLISDAFVDRLIAAMYITFPIKNRSTDIGTREHWIVSSADAVHIFLYDESMGCHHNFCYYHRDFAGGRYNELYYHDFKDAEHLMKVMRELILYQASMN